MVDQGISPHSLQNGTSQCRQFWDFRRQMLWWTSLAVDETGSKDLGEGYGVVYGRGNSRISLLDAATDLLLVFNMSASMVRQGGWVQQEQSDMRSALKMAKKANELFWPNTIEQTRQLIKTPLLMSGKRRSGLLNFREVDTWRLG